MSIISTKTGRKLLKKAKSLCLLPYVYDGDVADYVLGQTIYDLSAIIGDSIVLEQSDGETTTKENEFTGQPLVENITMGTWKFTAQCLDLQNSVLKALFGAKTSSEFAGLAALPSDYETLYALIRVRFHDTSTPDVYLPKVLLNSKLLMQQLKTRGSQGNIAGTLFNQTCCVIYPDRKRKYLAQFSGVNGESPFVVSTPVLFCPQDMTPLFQYRYDGGEYLFSQVNWTTANNNSVRHRIIVENDQTTTPWEYTEN